MEIVEVVENICARAKASRKFARLMVFMNIVIVIAILGIFFLSPSQHSLNSDLDTRVIFEFPGVKYQKDQSLSVPKELQLADAASEELLKLTEQNKKLKLEASERSFLMNIIGDTVLRFGSVLLAIYLIQILVTFTRYHFRVASHLDASADALKLSAGDLETFEKVSKIVNPLDIEFGASPSAPLDKIGDIIRDSITKLPGNKSA